MADQPGSEDEPRLLSGGNPQIARGDGPGPVARYLAAMPGWKGAVGVRVDALVSRLVPDARRAVRWNSPFYGVDGQGWFLTMHCFNRYVKVSFLNGVSLEPEPPVAGKDPTTRSLHVHEKDTLDEAALERWILQAAAIPGERIF